LGFQKLTPSLSIIWACPRWDEGACTWGSSHIMGAANSIFSGPAHELDSPISPRKLHNSRCHQT
jgi:hypothetical protein